MNDGPQVDAEIEAPGQQAELERDALITAAAEVLARSGWWGFKVESVLRQARLSTRSFYRQFETKDDLLAALLERDLLRIANEVDRIIDVAAPVEDRFWQYVNALVAWSFDDDFAKSAALFASTVRNLRTSHAEQFERCMVAITAPLVEILKEGRRLGVIATDNPVDDARIVQGLIGVSVFDGPETEPSMVRTYLARSVVPFIGRSFGVQVPASGLPALTPD
ncbi:TetR/AcrR family transcriptional regulator [[Mycobacterium] vasticus]|uniref:TetR/AcrR family transcriptional regulator n=1 Tax=[Mycobacterium] vasticus TaxID=2875777 RepID=A0ABU5YYP7_9MYCO|nr:TetR/AcrR family transcriptional regulator [Mycolicibacter sp. MYC017]MEB3070262.1 TetR/AcrR family transcriptional regulator [Mycolicibacter sp. MYC017]